MSSCLDGGLSLVGGPCELPGHGLLPWSPESHGLLLVPRGMEGVKQCEVLGSGLGRPGFLGGGGGGRSRQLGFAPPSEAPCAPLGGESWVSAAPRVGSGPEPGVLQPRIR